MRSPTVLLLHKPLVNRMNPRSRAAGDGAGGCDGSFMCQPDPDTECPDLGSNVILGASVRVVLDGLNL